ncbi:hypothetical protein [Kordia sp.]|uniref:hypothetical protein n=1 Tax=Kordia sp. TaxID=1965332 RepID=UPI003D6ADA5D
MKKRNIKNLMLKKETISILTDKEKLGIEGGITPITTSSAVCVGATARLTIYLSEKYCPSPNS